MLRIICSLFTDALTAWRPTNLPDFKPRATSLRCMRVRSFAILSIIPPLPLNFLFTHNRSGPIGAQCCLLPVSTGKAYLQAVETFPMIAGGTIAVSGKILLRRFPEAHGVIGKICPCRVKVEPCMLLNNSLSQTACALAGSTSPRAGGSNCVVM